MTTHNATLKPTDPKAAVPVLLFSFVFCLIVDNGFKTMTGPMAEGLGIDPNTASLQASLAGVIIGIGAVVYAALADAISIRKLMLIGIGLVVVGSVIGFVFSGSWPLVLAGRLIQTGGLAAAETLYVIYVTKHLAAEDQKTYLGFSTAAFQSGLLVGALTSGAISTYIGWRVMFLVPLILIVAVPFILKTVPEEEASSSHLDVVGLFLIAIFATSVIQYMQAFKLFWLAFMLVSIVIFVWYVRNAKNPVVNPEFFKNGRYVWAILLVLIVYSTQLGYIVLLPFAAKEFHGLDQAQASYLMIPGYICAVLIGIFSGKIGKLMTSRRTIFTALGMIIVALVVGALAIQVHVAVAIASIILFASGFALLYAPLVNTALANILPEKSGVAIGFYNLTINIGVPLGIACTFKLMNLSIGTNAVIWILAAIAVVGAVMYFIADRALFSREKAAGIDSVANH
ncbi:MFS transporter [Corynebacterium diphtheriae]|nr:MFS transporter [Corynebacterium diphtheriae]